MHAKVIWRLTHTHTATTTSSDTSTSPTSFVAERACGWCVRIAVVVDGASRRQRHDATTNDNDDADDDYGDDNGDYQTFASES